MDVPLLRVSAVKRTERRDRFYCVRRDGAEVSWAVTSAPGLPHDLCHLVVESGLRLRRGFWGMVADGMEPARVRAVAEHLDSDRGEGLTELMQAEAAVVDLLGGEEEPAGRLTALAARLAGQGVAPPAASEDDVVAVRAEAARLAGEWERLAPGRALDLSFDVPDPA